MELAEVTKIVEILKVLTPMVAIVGGIIGVLKFLGVRTRNEKMREVGEDFRTVVDSLSSDNEVQRLAAAILLRRFFDPLTESGIAQTPYAKEAVSVIAALLRDMPEGKLQKLLSDGLAYAPDLRNADLQHTNLSQAYLGDRVRHGIDISGADFFEADLSGASLNGITAKKTVFYLAACRKTRFAGACLCGTDFRDADLQGARFDGADLTGARFDGADLTSAQFDKSDLEGARFSNVTGLAPDIASRLDTRNVYHANAN